MKKLASKVDSSGVFIENVIVDLGFGELAEDIVLQPVPDGFFRPRWTGKEWVEDMTQSEIDAITNQPKPVNPSDVLGERIVQLEIENLQLKRQNEALGSSLVNIELRLLGLEGGNG